MSTSRLFRSESDKMIAGVCGGLAAYLDIDPVLVRLGFVVLAIATFGLPLYIIMAIITPSETALDTEELIHFATDDIGSLKNGEVQEQRNTSFIAGLFIVAGAFFLFGNFGINIWPIALIALGIWFVVRRN